MYRIWFSKIYKQKYFIIEQKNEDLDLPFSIDNFVAEFIG